MDLCYNLQLLTEIVPESTLVKAKVKGQGEKEATLFSIIDNLGAAEQKHTNDNFKGKLLDWARLIDRVDELMPVVESIITDQTRNRVTTAKAQYDEILVELKQLDFNTNSQVVQNIQNRLQTFKNQGHAEELISIIQKSKALNEDIDNAEQLKKLIAKASTERKRFEESIAKTSTEIKEGATRTLATHFQHRIDELQESKTTNPKDLLKSRNSWLGFLGAVTSGLVCVYVFFAYNGWTAGYEIQVLVAKIAILFIISSQVYFKQRNFNIYSDLIARYKHMYVVASTITDYLGVEADQELKTKLINTGVETMFSSVETGHLRQSDFHDREQINNIISNLPFSKQ